MAPQETRPCLEGLVESVELFLMNQMLALLVVLHSPEEDHAPQVVQMSEASPAHLKASVHPGPQAHSQKSRSRC